MTEEDDQCYTCEGRKRVPVISSAFITETSHDGTITCPDCKGAGKKPKPKINKRP